MTLIFSILIDIVKNPELLFEILNISELKNVLAEQMLINHTVFHKVILAFALMGFVNVIFGGFISKLIAIVKYVVTVPYRWLLLILKALFYEHFRYIYKGLRTGRLKMYISKMKMYYSKGILHQLKNVVKKENQELIKKIDPNGKIKSRANKKALTSSKTNNLNEKVKNVEYSSPVNYVVSQPRAKTINDNGYVKRQHPIALTERVITENKKPEMQKNEKFKRKDRVF